MNLLFEEILIYGLAFGLIIIVLMLYIRKLRTDSQKVELKINKAIEEGVHEPLSLHPVIDLNTCIKSGACVKACPEKDILGIRNGRATLINASQCVGHGACFHACPVEAISLQIGTEKRGVDLPHVNQNFETNVSGIYIAGELGGMGLIKNSVEQGKQAMDSIYASINKNHPHEFDVLIIGAGPAGISASLQAKRHKLKCITLEQDSLGGTVFNFPRAKVVMTAPMDLPLHGKIKLFQTSKVELLNIWNNVLGNNQISIEENAKVEKIELIQDGFEISTMHNKKYTSHKVLLAIGRRGSPRKLGVPGEQLEKVAYRLLEPEQIVNKKIIIVGGGDSAIESALLLAGQNKVILSYRGEKFNRLKPQNNTNLDQALKQNQLEVWLQSNLKEIKQNSVSIQLQDPENIIEIENDMVFIFAGGELPTQFLEKTGIQITKRFGYTVKSHNR